MTIPNTTKVPSHNQHQHSTGSQSSAKPKTLNSKPPATSTTAKMPHQQRIKQPTKPPSKAAAKVPKEQPKKKRAKVEVDDGELCPICDDVCTCKQTTPSATPAPLLAPSSQSKKRKRVSGGGGSSGASYIWDLNIRGQLFGVEEADDEDGVSTSSSFASDGDEDEEAEEDEYMRSMMLSEGEEEEEEGDGLDEAIDMIYYEPVDMTAQQVAARFFEAEEDEQQRIAAITPQILAAISTAAKASLSAPGKSARPSTVSFLLVSTEDEGDGVEGVNGLVEGEWDILLDASEDEDEGEEGEEGEEDSSSFEDDSSPSPASSSPGNDSEEEEESEADMNKVLQDMIDIQMSCSEDDVEEEADRQPTTRPRSVSVASAAYLEASRWRRVPVNAFYRRNRGHSTIKSSFSTSPTSTTLNMQNPLRQTSVDPSFIVTPTGGANSAADMGCLSSDTESLLPRCSAGDQVEQGGEDGPGGQAHTGNSHYTFYYSYPPYPSSLDSTLIFS